MASRYIIGIDLGTTNTAVCYVDTRSAEQRVQVFPVPQLVAPGEVQERRQLPSFIYLTGEHDLGANETALPWDDAARRVVGELARTQGARVPGRMISSAKSWLCHSGVDRSKPILPWGDDASDVTKLSPVDASARVLHHIKDAWDHVHAEQSDSSFADQELIITVPASFDEAARELTLAAAASAGFTEHGRDGQRDASGATAGGSVVLLEEPQAAFYAWIDSHPARERAEALRAGDEVLVFDIGGGTTDFTLISVGEDGETFSRTAVGDHLLLGGDNIDLTLAKQVEHRLTRAGKGQASQEKKKKKKLDSQQWHGLVHACRLAKETLLGDESVESVPITVVGRSSKLIGGTLKTAIARAELVHTIHEGFFPEVERPATAMRGRGGLQEFGLPYASDPAVTRHLAGFLDRQQVARIDAVLFNGGAMTPAALRARVLEQIRSWQPDRGAPRELANELPEMAVARGAAYYGLVRRGLGARIRGGTARAFYVGVGTSKSDDGVGRGADMAVCLAPKGLEDGAIVELERDFAVLTNRPVSFKLFSSSSRDDRPGALVPVGDGTVAITGDGDSDLLELPPIVTVLRARGRSQVNVRLQIRITELGALEIWCREPVDQQSDDANEDAAHSWRLSFDMRAGGAAQSEDDATAELDPRIPEAKEMVKRAFSGKADELAQLMKRLETFTDKRRDEWSMTMTRALFDAALEVEEARKKSPQHEQRWLILTGFCLRPGNGAPLDRWRAKQMWRIFNMNLRFSKSEACRLAWWIAWRRIAGGLTQGQQEQLYDRLAQLFLPSQKQKKKWAEVKPTKQEATEMLRTLANLERLTQASKMKLGDYLVERLQTKKGARDSLNFWALGRIGSRVPLYGPLNAVVPAQKVERWLEQVLAIDWPDPEKASFPMAQLGRRTGDRGRDISDELRHRLAERLRQIPGGDRKARLVEEIVDLEAREERVALGDTLPAGLRLVLDQDDGDDGDDDADDDAGNDGGESFESQVDSGQPDDGA